MAGSFSFPRNDSQMTSQAELERQRGDINHRNAKLLDLLIPLVPPENTVEESVTEDDLRELMARAGICAPPN